MAVNGIVGANYLLTRIGNSYDDEDCVHAVVINLIRNCAGGDAEYRTAGCTELWNSFTKYKPGNKYHHIVSRKTLTEAKAEGLHIGDLPVIYNASTGKCEHIAYYMGGIGGYECVHSSASKGKVCGTTLKNGFTHVLRHRDIIGVSADDISSEADRDDVIDIPIPDEEIEFEEKDEENEMNILYYAKVATQGGALNLRSGASKGKNIICEIPYGTELAVIDNSNQEWTKVIYNGSTGYVSSGYLAYSRNAQAESENETSNENDTILSESTSLFGGTWGVFIPCSGKSAANKLAEYFFGGKALKANLGD